ncbi:peptidase associated/transthyretin-like domain-containing protein [Polaribacter glomeratus]|uniref:TonB-dependent receptor n=1 Tax=Polaribacter glomeratus TaxID=102 RepID=A0A2S7WW59_9FLAO|nr:hypothetical protein [Polaribacter glomeratus]PQJ81716.1 hypothetical protein BTO16_03645 [Polaribacter glomeratus]TXD66359.1 hypothetical protein ESX12_06130 [Polaribacter glomeratus]
MKKLLVLLLFCTSLFAFSQDVKRVHINGKIIVEGNDLESIAVYNTVTDIGTITDKNGEFVIEVALNDLLEIRGLEYQNFDVIINTSVLESKKLHIFLIEEINKLDEIILVSTKKLSGNLAIDLNKVNKFSQKLDVIYFGIKNDDTYKNTPDLGNQVRKRVIPSETQTITDGLNIVNLVDQLLIPLFRSEVKDKKAAGIPEVPAEFIKYYLGSNFLIENFNIPAHRVEEFIRYVEDDTFDFDLLNYGHEIEFLELINKKSKLFLDDKK